MGSGYRLKQRKALAVDVKCVWEASEVAFEGVGCNGGRMVRVARCGDNICQ